MIVNIRGVSESMRLSTSGKYHAWDKAVRDNWIDSNNKVLQKKAYTMLSDPTIYSYAFFKNPRDTTKPFKLYPYQDMIINDPNKRIIFSAANQIGKSITLCIKALTFSLNNPGNTVLMSSKTFPQSKDLLRQIKSFLQNSSLDYKYDIGDTETKTEIYFKHYDEKVISDSGSDGIKTEYVDLPQSRTICVPATEAALGYPANLALVDELAFYDDGEHFYNQILQPRTYTTKGPIMVFSNPNGQQGIFWKLWNTPEFSKYNFNFLDCPTNTQKEFDMLSRDLTLEQVDSTLRAVFTSPAGGFFTLQERKAMQVRRPSMLPSVITTPIYIFFDWAKTSDRTVRVIGIPISTSAGEWAKAVYIYEMLEYPQGTPYTKIVDEDLKDLIMSVGPKNVAMVGWDNTGVGRGIEDFVKRVQQVGVQAMPVDYSLENKSRIYTLFKLLAEQNRITIPYIDECDKQLSMLRFNRTTRGYYQVHHENERDRDDYPDSIAGLCSIMVSPDTPPVSAVII